MARQRKELSEVKRKISFSLSDLEHLRLKEMAFMWGLTTSQMISVLINQVYESRSFLNGYDKLSEEELTKIKKRRENMRKQAQERVELYNQLRFTRLQGFNRGITNVMVIEAPKRLTTIAKDPVTGKESKHTKEGLNIPGIFCEQLGDVWVVPYSSLSKISVVEIIQYPCYASVEDYFAGKAIAPHKLQQFMFSNRDYEIFSEGERNVLERLNDNYTGDKLELRLSEDLSRRHRNEAYLRQQLKKMDALDDGGYLDALFLDEMSAEDLEKAKEAYEAYHYYDQVAQIYEEDEDLEGNAESSQTNAQGNDEAHADAQGTKTHNADDHYVDDNKADAQDAAFAHASSLDAAASDGSARNNSGNSVNGEDAGAVAHEEGLEGNAANANGLASADHNADGSTSAESRISSLANIVKRSKDVLQAVNDPQSLFDRALKFNKLNVPNLFAKANESSDYQGSTVLSSPTSPQTQESLDNAKELISNMLPEEVVTKLFTNKGLNATNLDDVASLTDIKSDLMAANEANDANNGADDTALSSVPANALSDAKANEQDGEQAAKHSEASSDGHNAKSDFANLTLPQAFEHIPATGNLSDLARAAGLHFKAQLEQEAQAKVKARQERTKIRQELERIKAERLMERNNKVLERQRLKDELKAQKAEQRVLKAQEKQRIKEEKREYLLKQKEERQAFIEAHKEKMRLDKAKQREEKAKLALQEKAHNKALRAMVKEAKQKGKTLPQDTADFNKTQMARLKALTKSFVEQLSEKQATDDNAAKDTKAQGKAPAKPSKAKVIKPKALKERTDLSSLIEEKED